MEEGHCLLLQASGPQGLLDELQDAIQEPKVQLREQAPLPKRMQSLQLGVPLKMEKLAKAQQQQQLARSQLASLEGELHILQDHETVKSQAGGSGAATREAGGARHCGF
eukprot:2817572-Amphidinium_carterae.2